MSHRIASLLPSATEILCALGAGDELVGISHECDHPPGLEGRPVLTSAKFPPAPTRVGIDAAVRDVLRRALAVYDIDTERFADLRASYPEAVLRVGQDGTWVPWTGTHVASVE